ncbi:5-dehydro-2-deoxygluconokinase [Cypionkella sp.]|uniref:5-dehydro-2-deoxygluconokinase n=1 Tax=Cypionkella sp. TaxID=2811411 RepID=UPI0027185698|nr:5-dehydro-2-deoxygluconokinase [Cypionkella sp.]MDO8985817.1 5-dehydro-2-deoxygluconokinase [Cypionkella sp.]MDP2051397.1 5-dehydro-2-deoxygluconokinase [Cypionkella sp.]
MQRLWQRIKLNQFVVLGRVGMDLYADPPGTRIEQAQRYTSAIGGSAGNIAVALARQDVGAALLTCVSDDPIGRYCVAELTRYGVDTRYLRATAGEARNSLAVVETIASNCQSVLYRNGAADFCLCDTDVAAVDYSGVAALVVTGTALACEPSRHASFGAMAQARMAGALVVLDIDYRAYSWTSPAEAALICRQACAASDIIVGNDDEFGLLAGSHENGKAYAKSLTYHGALLSIYKRGAAGSITFTPDYSFETGIFSVTARKPMGAGDGFMGGLLAGLAQGHTLETSVRRGAATAALIVAGIGCAPASPDTAALDHFISQY